MGWQDWAFCSPGPRWRGEDRVHLVLIGAQLHTVGPPWASASPAAGCVAACSASDRPPAPVHGSSHTSMLLRQTATWRAHVPTSELSDNHECDWLLCFHWNKLLGRSFQIFSILNWIRTCLKMNILNTTLTKTMTLVKSMQKGTNKMAINVLYPDPSLLPSAS